MRVLWLYTLAACCCWAAPRDRSATVATDGSVVVPWRAAPGDQVISIGCGLPRVAPERKWEEDGVLHTLWVTNGIRYHQTVLVTPVRGAGRAGALKAVLLVNIAGENTNSEYAEAMAELSVEVGGRRQKLELAEGRVWRFTGENRFFLGALEIPPSGVKESSGEFLRFAGNMPPSEKGSLTLKIPLEATENEVDQDAVTDLVFEEQVQHAKKAGPEERARGVLVRFAEDPGRQENVCRSNGRL